MLPGIGSLLVGQWVSGLLQMAAATIGFAMTVYWLLGWLGQALREGSLPIDGGGPRFGYGLGGVLLFGLAWLWSVLASIAVVREVRRRRLPA